MMFTESETGSKRRSWNGASTRGYTNVQDERDRHPHSRQAWQVPPFRNWHGRHILPAHGRRHPRSCWLEVKTKAGRQTKIQKLFEGTVSNYYIVRSIDDAGAALSDVRKNNGENT